MATPPASSPPPPPPPLPPPGDHLLLPHILRRKATAPSHSPIYGSIPRSPADLSHGYRDVTYAQLSRAVDRAARWLDATLVEQPAHATTQQQTTTATATAPPLASAGEDGGGDKNAPIPPPTFAYFGPRDLRYPILVLAAIRTSRCMLIPSHLAAPDAHVHLLASSSSRAVLHAEDVLPARNLARIRAAMPELRVVEDGVPSQEDLLFGGGGGGGGGDEGEDVEPYKPYAKTFAQAQHDPVCIFHTSGSSGPPKPVTYTHGMLVRVLGRVDGLSARVRPRRLQGEVEPGWRWYSALPVFHVSGMKTALLNPLLRGTIVVLGPPSTAPVTARTASLALRHSRADAASFHPALLQDLVREPSYLAQLSRLRSIYFGASPLAKPAGDALLARAFGTLDPAIGCTESMHWLTFRPEDPARDWQYFEFHEAMAPRMDEHAHGLYELVFERTAASEEWTVFFDGNDLREFRTKDLWAPHPTKPGLWKYQGRTDDLVVLTGEVKLYAGKLEEKLCELDGVRAVLVGGYQRPTPFLLIEAIDPPSTASDQETILNRLWPAIEKENQDVLEQTRLRRQLALIAPQDKPFARLGKGSVSRRATFELFEEEIEIMYRSSRLQN